MSEKKKNVSDEFAKDVEGQTFSDEDLSTLARLAAYQLSLEAWIKKTELKLKDVQRQLFTVSSETIPQLMEQIGMKAFVLDSGERVQVKKVVKASVPAKSKAEALQWLRDNNAGALIKNEVTASFGKGDDKKAAKLVAALQKRGLNVTQKEGVHGNTLSAYVREQLEKGVDIPKELLGVFEYMETKIVKA